MNEFHSLLKRQLRRFTGDTKSLLEEQTDLLRAINNAYLQFDADRRMLEHSLELTSQELLERNAELSRINTDLEMRVAARTAELSSSEARFRGLFEHAPVSIWEEDFSAVRQYIDDLRGAEVADISAYFEAHPEDVAECASRVKIVDVNRATLEMYKAESKAQLLADLSKVLGPESWIPFKEELLALARGETSFENETVNYTLRGERRVVFVRLTVAPGYEQTWAKVFVGISDITERTQVQEALRKRDAQTRLVVDLALDAVITIDSQSRIIGWNPQAEAIFGWSRQEAIGQALYDLIIPAQYREAHQRGLTHFLVSGEGPVLNRRIEITGLRRNGYEFPVELAIAPVNLGETFTFTAFIRDITERRQAEAALAAERDLLQALMDNIPDLIYFKDSSSRFTRINRAEAALLGVVTPEQATGKTELDFQNPALARGFYEEEQRLVQTGEALINRIEFNLTPDGQPRWFSATKVPIKDADGNVTRIVGISRDITERKQIEDALRESETRYRLAMLATNDVIWEWNSNTKQLTWTENAQLVLGYSPEEISSDQWWDNHIHPDDRQRVTAQMASALSSTETIWSSEYRFLLKDGSYAYISDHGYIERDANDTAIRMIGAMSNVTARKMAEEALRQSEERFKLMAWATKDAVWDWNLQTNQIWWGEGLQKIFHYSSERTQTNPEWRLDHIHPEDRAKVNRVIDQALEGGMEFWSKEYRFQRKDETYADIMDRGYIIRDDTGKPYRMIGAMMDITERKHMESTLLQANEQMGQFVNELQRRNREVALLNEMSRLLQACQSTEEAYRIIADLSSQLFPSTAGALYLLNTARTLVSAIASWGELPSIERMFAPDDCWALRSGQTHPLNEDRTGSRCLHLSEPPPAISYCLPLHAQGETLGVLHVQSRHEESFDEAKRQLAYTVVEQAGMALSNLKLREALREQSIRDPLTGLYNRRYMEEALKQQLSRLTRQLHPLGIIMIDIDHFKDFNDTYGHAAGDALLRELGQFLQRHIRGEDIACRYGGEEFTLIMPDALLEVAQQRAEHLRQGASQLRVQDAGQSHGAITLSAGVAIYPQHGRTIETVLRAADDALYRAKQEGRDRVIVAERAY